MRMMTMMPYLLSFRRVPTIRYQTEWKVGVQSMVHWVERMEVRFHRKRRQQLPSTRVRVGAIHADHLTSATYHRHQMWPGCVPVVLSVRLNYVRLDWLTTPNHVEEITCPEGRDEIYFPDHSRQIMKFWEEKSHHQMIHGSRGDSIIMIRTSNHDLQQEYIERSNPFGNRDLLYFLLHSWWFSSRIFILLHHSLCSLSLLPQNVILSITVCLQSAVS